MTRGGICVPPTVTYLPYRVSGSTLNGRRAFSVAGPMAWNLLPDFIRDPTSSTAQTVLGVYLKRTCSRVTSASSTLGFLTIMRYTNPRTHSLPPVAAGGRIVSLAGQR